MATFTMPRSRQRERARRNPADKDFTDYILIKIKLGTVQHIDLMLIRKDGIFNFAMSQRDILKSRKVYCLKLSTNRACALRNI